MVANHTARWWMDLSAGWGRYYLAYLSVTLPAPIFLFLVGFCLPISFRRRPERPPFRATLPRYLRRGVELILANMLLNMIMFPEDPIWMGGVLQTIGLAVLLVAPLMWVAHHRWVQWGALAAAVVMYLAFAGAYPVLQAWPAPDTLVSEVFFRDFPPWPWLSPALVGLVFGWWWLDARRNGPEAEARYFKTAAIVAVACLAAYFLWDWWTAQSPRVSYKRDFLVNHHWTPAGATNFLVVGGVAGLLALTWWLMEVKQRAFPWLVTLGQAAFMLYFIHQVFILVLVRQRLGLAFNDWTLFVPANLVLVVGMVYAGRAWLEIKSKVRLREIFARAP